LPLPSPQPGPFVRLANFGLSLVCLMLFGKTRRNFGQGFYLAPPTKPKPVANLGAFSRAWPPGFEPEEMVIGP